MVPLNNGKGPGTDKWEEKYGEQRAPVSFSLSYLFCGGKGGI